MTASAPRPQDVWLEDVTAPRSLRRLPATLARAVALVARAAPRVFVVTVVLQLLGAVALAGVVLLGGRLLQAVVVADREGAGLRQLAGPVLLLAGASVTASLVAPVLAQLQRLLAELAQRRTYERVLDVAGEAPLEAFETAAFFDRLQRVQANAVLRPLLVARSVVDLAGGAVGVVGLVAALLAVEPLLLPLLLTAGLPLLLVSRRASRAEYGFAVAQTARLRVRDYLRGVLLGRAEAKEVRAFALQDVLRRRYDRLYDEYVHGLRSQVRLRVRLAVMSSVLVTVVTIATMVVLVQLVLSDRLTLAGAGASALAVRLLSSRLELSFSALGTLLESALFLDELERFAAPSTAPGAAPGTAAPPVFEELRLEGVGFTYPGSDRRVLDDVSLSLRRGEVLALVGENGSGKTTLAKLLAGLFRPTEGRILWDEGDVASFDVGSYRRRVAVIFQDFLRYALPARDNIALAAGDDGAVVAAARRAGAHAFLAALPHGYATVLSKEFADGADLSGGQWQRVALARAFHRDAPLVVLDEPTAALDPRAEHELFSTVRTLLADRTVLLISHRLATVRTADRIVVLQSGRVVEEGTHDELMRLEGTYAELFRLQAAGYTAR